MSQAQAEAREITATEARTMAQYFAARIVGNGCVDQEQASSPQQASEKELVAAAAS